MESQQKRKRLSSCYLTEKCRSKKKMNSYSSDCRLQAVDEMQQVGITWMDMGRLFPKSHLSLAGVISLPEEIFELNNLSDVLSYEVWETCLTESERKHLTQFLPNGTEDKQEQVAHSLLTGENHHFGNPLLEWSTSLCSGDRHPKILIYTSQQLRDNRLIYYEELKQYHDNMIDLLFRWKEAWVRCSDPEKLLREGPTKRKQGSLTYHTRDYESLSKSKRRAKTSTSETEKPPIICIKYGDDFQNMSYSKISSEEYRKIRNFKPPGSSFTLGCLRQVLGDRKEFLLQNTCKEGEEKRVHEHWIKLVREDIPTAYECFREKLKKYEMGKVLKPQIQEMRMLMEKKRRNVNSSIPERHDAHTLISPDVTPIVQRVANYHRLELTSLTNSQQELIPRVSKEIAAASEVTPPLAGSSPVPTHFHMSFCQSEEINKNSFSQTIPLNPGRDVSDVPPTFSLHGQNNDLSQSQLHNNKLQGFFGELQGSSQVTEKQLPHSNTSQGSCGSLYSTSSRCNSIIH